MKIKWKVSSEATGPYRSFHPRSWPTADYPDGRIAAQITCTDEYRPAWVREGKHAQLTVRVADYSVQPRWQWKKMVGTFATLKEAKEAFARLLVKHPELMPVEYQGL